ncbi:MAG TPA: bifunctional proline dehydrogenase/L-glutamate gamma-semialdehyde dehydrogenase PutA, partial [Rhizomicrobium sp.]|nr:bifunctional proline dehydrogenase/L-glutamate gamma-semialdehyde dehydrogenase PutA [Rhizomicrobium sp.]
MQTDAALRRAISAAYLEGENAAASRLLDAARLSPREAEATEALARALVMRMRAEQRKHGGLDAFLHEYALSTQEGVVLMCLAEALLRVPDTETADRLIRDKIGGGEWARHAGKSSSPFVNASTFALMLTGRIVTLDEASRWDFDGIWRKLVARSGEPLIRQAVTYAMRILGRQFVLGRTIDEALKNAKSHIVEGYRYSFDMLGEAAYTREDAGRYLEAYRGAISVLAKQASGVTIFERPSISVKLSALHPRYEWVKRERVMAELLPPLVTLAAQAARAGLGLTVDAEEADRLDLMLDMFEALSSARELQAWDGLGLAVQAYQKRALPLIAWVADLAHRHNRRIPVRLVKGAYWDTEIKRAQEAGLSDYPVFTRKQATDVSYLVCARAMLAAGEAIYPQFATHNAHTLAAIKALADGRRDFEFQRLHGMGDLLYEIYHGMKGKDAAPTRIYAPVGSHEDLLAYLVRRLLENGANTSFVNRLADDESPIETIIADPATALAAQDPKRNPRIPLPQDVMPGRKNSSGFLWSDPAINTGIIAEMEESLGDAPRVGPIVGGEERNGEVHPITNPSDRRRIVGEVSDAAARDAIDALIIADRGQIEWDAFGGEARAQILERAADLYERDRAHLMALAVREAGKTLPNALGEVREAVDFLRYYASRARAQFAAPTKLPGPTGEDNEIALYGRGVFACISPWNFPLAIFTGQIAGALAAGNAVLAKPAEQTPLVAGAAVKLLHEAGVPRDVLHYIPGDGLTIGNALFSDARLAGVAFTGSTETATTINRALAARDGPLATLIAETGGQNAMIVDST